MTTKPKAQAIRRDAVDSGGIGYLEVFHNHSWHAVCADGMNVNIANVLCTQLGYDGAFAVGDLGMKTPLIRCKAAEAWRSDVLWYGEDNQRLYSHLRLENRTLQWSGELPH